MVVIKTNFLSDEVPKESKHYTCITNDSIIRMEKKNCPQVYLEKCKYKIKKTKMTNFIKAELESESESESELESDIELDVNRTSHRRCSIRKTVLRNFANFTGKHLIKKEVY